MHLAFRISSCTEYNCLTVISCSGICFYPCNLSIFHQKFCYFSLFNGQIFLYFPAFFAFLAVCLLYQPAHVRECTAGPLDLFSIFDWINVLSIFFPISPPRASSSLTRCPLELPPTFGLHGIMQYCHTYSKYHCFKPSLAPQVLLHILHDRHRLLRYHSFFLCFILQLPFFFISFYFPIQNLLNISFTRSSPTDSPMILPRFSYAFIRSMEKKSSAIPIRVNTVFLPVSDFQPSSKCCFMRAFVIYTSSLNEILPGKTYPLIVSSSSLIPFLLCRIGSPEILQDSSVFSVLLSPAYPDRFYYNRMIALFSL